MYVNLRCYYHNEISPLIKYENTYAPLDYNKAKLLNDHITSVFKIDNGVIPEHITIIYRFIVYSVKYKSMFRSNR